jgi:hypothetical protein
MQNNKNEDKSSFFGKIDDIEAFVTESWGYLPNFDELREQLIEDVKEHQRILRESEDKMNRYGELMRQGKYMEAASLIITPEQMDRAILHFGEVYFFFPRVKTVDKMPEPEDERFLLPLIEIELIHNDIIMQDRIDMKGFVDLPLDLDWTDPYIPHDEDDDYRPDPTEYDKWDPDPDLDEDEDGDWEWEDEDDDRDYSESYYDETY